MVSVFRKLIHWNDQSLEKEGNMEKKYLKKMLTGLSIASLVAGMTGAVVSASGWGGKKAAKPAASGWSGSQKGAVSTQVKEEAPAPGYGEEKKESSPGYGEEEKKEGVTESNEEEEKEEAAETEK